MLDDDKEEEVQEQGVIARHLARMLSLTYLNNEDVIILKSSSVQDFR